MRRQVRVVVVTVEPARADRVDLGALVEPRRAEGPAVLHVGPVHAPVARGAEHGERVAFVGRVVDVAGEGLAGVSDVHQSNVLSLLSPESSVLEPSCDVMLSPEVSVMVESIVLSGLPVPP